MMDIVVFVVLVCSFVRFVVACALNEIALVVCLALLMPVHVPILCPALLKLVHELRILLSLFVC